MSAPAPVPLWALASLGDIIELHDHKRVPLNSRQRAERPGPYPYYGAQGVIDYVDDYLFDGRYILLAEDGENLNSRKLPIASFADGKFWVNNHAHILRGLPEYVDDVYLLAALNQADIKAFVTGAAQPKLSQASLRLIKLPLPALPVQRRIAGVIAAYDGLIENCQRRIRILEEMARALYREWFVLFRYPGHEKVPLVDSPLGEVPKSWRVARLDALADVNGASLDIKSPPESIHYVDISCVSPGRIDGVKTLEFSEAPGRARRIVRHGDVLWSCVRPNRRSHALVLRPLADTVASTGFAVLSATRIPYSYLYFATTTDDFVAYLTNHATGAAYPAVTAKTFGGAEVLEPPADILDAFHSAAAPMLEQRHVLERRAENLRTTRDLLLPRLLSGKIRLEDVG